MRVCDATVMKRGGLGRLGGMLRQAIWEVEGNALFYVGFVVIVACCC